MSAQLAGDTGNSFHARLLLAAGVSVAINAPSMQALSSVVALLQPTEAANEGNGVRGATAPVGQPATPTTAPSAQRAAEKAAGDAGNASASTATPASVQPAASGSAHGGDAGNAGAGAHPGAGSAQTASADKPAASSPVTFEELKKAFLALSAKAGGREKCEAVLKAVDPAPAKLSAATPEQYPALMAAIQKHAS